MREQFEKLPEIADSLSDHIVFIGNKYTTPNLGFYDLVNWLNGAWYAFQEQQKKIDKALELGYEKRGGVHYLVDDHINDIQGLLE